VHVPHDLVLYEPVVRPHRLLVGYFRLSGRTMCVSLNRIWRVVSLKEMIEFPGKFALICKLTLSSIQEGLTFEVYTVRPTGSVLRNDFDIRTLRSACELWSNHLTTFFSENTRCIRKAGQVLILLQRVVRIRITAWDGTVTQ
jgi:hypothetical protein